MRLAARQLCVSGIKNGAAGGELILRFSAYILRVTHYVPAVNRIGPAEWLFVRKSNLAAV
jgi:hypothetical protein